MRRCSPERIFATNFRKVEASSSRSSQTPDGAVSLRIRYSVQHHGIPVGTVQLIAGELSVGTLSPAPGYAALQHIVRDASIALLQVGVYGAAARVFEAPDTAMLSALTEAARLVLELRGADGEQVPTTFVNLIEAPGDSRVVVLARFSHSHASEGAMLTPPLR
jgi:hypothetical protein